MRHRWPTLIGIVAGVAIAVPGGVEVTTSVAAATMGMAALYLVFGAARGELRDLRIIGIEVAGVAAMAGLAGVALAVDEPAGAYVLATTWFAHSIWDYVHHRVDRVVPRAWAELCAAIDAIVAVGILVAA